MLASLTHSIRTPLNSIVNANDIIDKKTTDEGTWSKWIEISWCSCKILDSLISNAVDYTDFETDQFVPLFEEFELITILNEIQEISEPQARLKGLEFSIEVKPGVPQIFKTDRRWITSVLVILV